MQQEPQATHQLTALAIVIESSLAIAQEWPAPLFQYLMHLFKRISDAHHPSKLRVAFVGYGTIDTVPSPLLCKRFFTENTMVFREIFQEPMHFGIGMSNSGGSRGMAALEGLVAALEMFDDLQKIQNTKISGSFIVHIAASAPDNSLRPEWNDSELMDDVSWDSLPVEFKKRSIAYNLLTLRPPQGRLAELYATMNTSTDTSPPWFELRSSFTLSAASIVSLQPPNKVINKRQSDMPASTEQPSDKRPRLQPVPKDSPKPMPTLPPPRPPSAAQQPEPDRSTQTPSLSQSQPQAPPQLQQPPQTQTQPAEPSVPQPTAPPTTKPATHPPSQINNPVQVPFPGNLSPEELLQRFSNATEVMRKIEATMHASIAAGDMERAEAMRTEYERKKPQYERLKSFIHHYRQVMAMKQNSAQPANDGGGSNVPTGKANPSMPPANSEMTQPQTNLQMNKIHPSTSNPGINSGMPNILTNPQMQQMMEQKLQQQLGSSVQPVSVMGMQNPNPMATPFATGGESVTGMGGMSTGHHMANGRPNVEWTGMLKFSGQVANGMREMQCGVTISSALGAEEAHPATWPKAMELRPVDKIPLMQLQEWIKKQQTCLCSFKALPTEADQASYTMLMQLLDTTHAVASWTVPSGIHPTRNAIFFTYYQRNMRIIAGAFFPLTGIPDSLPKAIPPQMGGASVPHSGFPSQPSMPQNMRQAFEAMSMTERQQFVKQITMRQNLIRQQQQQAQAAQMANQQGAGISSFNPNMQLPIGNQVNTTSALGMMSAGGGPSQGNFMNRNSQTPGGMTTGQLGGAMPMNPGVPSGGNMSYEALQALLQRNSGGGMNMGQNMGQKTL